MIKTNPACKIIKDLIWTFLVRWLYKLWAFIPSSHSLTNSQIAGMYPAGSQRIAENNLLVYIYVVSVRRNYRQLTE